MTSRSVRLADDKSFVLSDSVSSQKVMPCYVLWTFLHFGSTTALPCMHSGQIVVIARAATQS